MNSNALITDVQRFSLHDGPGIRTTVFMKGCNLRCEWCHNPETRNALPQALYELTRCIGCGACAAACPDDALRLTASGIVREQAWCRGCLKCAQVCNHDAMRAVGRRIDAAELEEILLRDTRLYGGQGGVTFSGGEPLLQAGFIREMGERLQQAGVRIAVDTAGCIEPAALDTVLPVTDLWLYDVKVMDENTHIRYTGQSNRMILNNLRYLDGKGAAVWIRRPMVLGVNDTNEDLEAFCALILSLTCVRRVELLPYHDYGLDKARGLGEKPTSFLAPDAQRIVQIADVVRKAGVQVTIRK